MQQNSTALGITWIGGTALMMNVATVKDASCGLLWLLWKECTSLHCVTFGSDVKALLT